MPNKAAKFSSEYLSQEQMHAALVAVPGEFQAMLGEYEIITSYGWGTNIHIDLQYKPMREDTRRLEYHIADSIEQRIVVPGQSDFRFEVPEDRLDLLFCHERDIHLDGSDEELLLRFIRTEPFA